MKETNHSMSRKTRTILIVAAILLACFVVVMAIVLIVPHAGASNETEIESIQAYNEEHGTDYLYPDPPQQTADLYTNKHTYLYRKGLSDQMLRMQFTYAGSNYCTFYVLLDADADLAEEETFSFLQNYTNLNREQTWAVSSGGDSFTVQYRKQGGAYFAKFGTDGALYYLNVESESSDPDGYFGTIVYTIIGRLVENS